MASAKKVVITGGAGFVGQALAKRLQSAGYQPIIFDIRKPNWPTEFWQGNLLTNQPPSDLLENCQAVVHLAGRPIFGRVSKRIKQEIYDSRVLTTKRLIEAFRRLHRPPETFVVASAVGYYGDQSDRWLDEDSPPGNDWLAEICQAWELAAEPAEEMGIRVVNVRTATVVGSGGLVTRMRRPIKLLGGFWFGRGRGDFPWVSLTDLTRIYQFVLDRPIKGVVNAVSPSRISQKMFLGRLAEHFGRPQWLPMPIWLLRLSLGEMANYLDYGQRISPTRLLEAGFIFQEPTLELALASVNR